MFLFGETDFDNSFQKFMSRHGNIDSFGKCDTALISQDKAIFIGSKAMKISLSNKEDEYQSLQNSDDYY